MTHPRMLNVLGRVACIGVTALFISNNSSAQDSHWSGLANNGLWADPNNWNPVGVPRSVDQGLSTNGGNVFLDAAGGWSVMTITNGEVESPGVQDPLTLTRPPYNTIFGPEFGAGLNIYGTLNYDWVIAPVQNNPAPGARSIINMYTNSVVNTSGAGLALGDEWWYWAAPYVTLNMYANAQYNILGGAGLWLGGHLNIYDTAVMSIGNYINMDSKNSLSDGTRSFNLGGGSVILPAGGYGNTVTNWVGRGVLRLYGKGFDYDDLVITDNGTNTVVAPQPLGGALLDIAFQPLLRSTVMVGTFQQITLVGDYPAVSGVLLSSAEPGLNPAVTGVPVYTSSNTKVATVDANGILTAVRPGTATITAKLGTLSGTNSVTLTVVPVSNSLIHRYSFSETTGTTSADSIPGNSPTWDATLNGNATLGGGQVTLDGTNGYVQLPAGILSGYDEVTIEAWATFGSPINTWANLFAFGNSDGATNGQDYVTFQPHTGGGGTQGTFGQGDPGFNAERNCVINNTLDGMTNIQVAMVYHPLAGYEALYTNGVLFTTVTMFNNLIDPVAYSGPTYTNGSILAFTLGADPINYIGHSLYGTDPTLNGSIDEFRIYQGPLTSSQVMADYALGPNALVGTSTHVSLTVAHSGSNVLISWPTTSALVTLMSSPTLGPGAVWTPVNPVLSVSGGNYQASVPVSGAANFFRLQ